VGIVGAFRERVATAAASIRCAEVSSMWRFRCRSCYAAITFQVEVATGETVKAWNQTVALFALVFPCMGFTSRPVVVACGELSALAVGGSSYFPSFPILRHQPRARAQNGHLAVRAYLRPRIASSNVFPDGIKPSRLKHAFSLESASWHTPA
jgi:hypothetical protein